MGQRVAPVGPDLGLTRELSDDLFDWNEVWSARKVEDPLPAGWQDEGSRLVLRLRDELKEIAEVRPEFLH